MGIFDVLRSNAKGKEKTKTKGKKKSKSKGGNDATENGESRNPKNRKKPMRGEKEERSAMSSRADKRKGSRRRNMSSSAQQSDDFVKCEVGIKQAAANSPEIIRTPAPSTVALTVNETDEAPTLPLRKLQTAQSSTSREMAVAIAASREGLSTSTPPEAVKPAASQPTNVVAVEKWAAESTAKAWMDKADFAKAKDEYDSLQKMTVDVEKDCKKWKAHPKLNQSDDYPALDANLAKCPDANDYVNISQVEVPLRRNVYIGQIPTDGSEETFWKAIFELRVTSMHILNEEAVGFFPQQNGDFVHYGTMFVNNRRAENIGEDVLRFAIEVLPAGMSNSIIATVTVIKNWNMDTVHPKQAVVMKEVLEMSTFLGNALPDENALILSRNGAGRAGYFVALAVAVSKMDAKTEPNIAEIVRAIRAQRPKAVDTITQYASLYIAMFYYIKKKMGKTGDTVVERKTANAECGDALCKKSAQLTQLFTSALIAEIAANTMKSTRK